MKRIENLRDLLVEEGRVLYDANRQEQKELKALEMQASTFGLKKLIKEQAQQAENQQQHLREAFHHLQENCEGGKCEATQIILNRAQQLIDQSKGAEVRDAGIISSLQQLNHHKIASLGNSASHAREIGQEEAAKIFHDALEQEKEIDRKLSTLAQLDINKKAVVSALLT